MFLNQISETIFSSNQHTYSYKLCKRACRILTRFFMRRGIEQVECHILPTQDQNKMIVFANNVSVCIVFLKNPQEFIRGIKDSTSPGLISSNIKAISHQVREKREKRAQKTAVHYFIEDSPVDMFKLGICWSGSVPAGAIVDVEFVSTLAQLKDVSNQENIDLKNNHVNGILILNKNIGPFKAGYLVFDCISALESFVMHKKISRTTKVQEQKIITEECYSRNNIGRNIKIKRNYTPIMRYKFEDAVKSEICRTGSYYEIMYAIKYGYTEGEKFFNAKYSNTSEGDEYLLIEARKGITSNVITPMEKYVSKKIKEYFSVINMLQ